MSAAKFFAENLSPPMPLTEQQRAANMIKGLLALAEQLDRMETRQRNADAQLQQMEQILRGLR